MVKDNLSKIMERLSRRYPGKYVAIIDGRVVASGKSQLAVFRKAEKGVPQDKEIGVYYIPTRSAHPLLLKSSEFSL